MKIGNYKNLEVGKTEFVAVSEDEIKEELDKMLAQAKSFVPQDKKAELGDVVNINYEGFLDGVPFDGGKADGYDLELGSHTFIPGFEEGLIGFSKGENVDVNVTFPTEYHAENLAGKPVVFKCLINEVKVKNEPKLDDDFAKGFGIETIAELKAELERQMNVKKQNELDNEYLNKLIGSIIEASEIEVDETKVQARIDEIVAYYENNIAQYGMDINGFLQMTGKTMESFRDELVDEAVNSLNGEVLIEEISKLEGITATDEEVANELKLYKDYYQMPEEAFESFKKEKQADIALEIVKRKTAKLLIDSNN